MFHGVKRRFRERCDVARNCAWRLAHDGCHFGLRVGDEPLDCSSTARKTSE